MPNKFFSAEGVWQGNILAIVRITIGAFLIYHGSEIFEKAKMDEYGKWIPDMKLASPLFASYLGKALELISGILLLTGFLTRLACVFILMTFLMITFYIGEGRVLMEEQYPFMFCIFAVLFLFLGAGNWSLDKVIFRR
jgi:putative oxidoreductase